MDGAQIRTELESCLLSDEEISTGNWRIGYNDDWSVQRAYAL